VRKQIWKTVRRVILGLVVILIILIIVYHDLVLYGLRQGKGQFNIIWNARPVSEYLEDPTFPDSLKAKLRLIDDVRKFAIDSLGLKDTENYKTLYDQKGKEIMWVVLAAKPFKLEPKEWTFPVIGAVPYKGFFNEELAIELKKELDAEGWDVIIRNPGGWSTLGWFTDPILSKMLNRSEGDLANLIIHEMSHATIFVKDSVDFNENLATFIGDRGAEQFLISKYGTQSKEYRQYMDEDKDYVKYVDHMLHGAGVLDSLYNTFSETELVTDKKAKKDTMIRAIIENLDTISFRLPEKPSARFKGKIPNNAYFMNFRQYQSQQDTFFREWRADFRSDLKQYIKYLADKYPFL
jgi:predicted aminopeptidase